MNDKAETMVRESLRIGERFSAPASGPPCEVTVIAAHGDGPEWRTLGRPWRPFLAMLRNYPNLYADTSAMCLLTRRCWLLKHLREEGAVEKPVQGSAGSGPDPRDRAREELDREGHPDQARPRNA